MSRYGNGNGRIEESEFHEFVQTSELRLMKREGRSKVSAGVVLHQRSRSDGVFASRTVVSHAFFAQVKIQQYKVVFIAVRHPVLCSLRPLFAPPHTA